MGNSQSVGIENPILSDISEKLGDDWKKLAIHLGFDEANIRAFEVNSPRDVHHQKFQMLTEWRQRQRSTEGQKDELCRALEKIYRYDIILLLKEVPIKCRRNKRKNLRKEIEQMIKDGGLPTKVVTTLKKCKAEFKAVEKGCMKLILGFRSVEGLETFWEMYSSGEIQECLSEELWIGDIEISEEDYRRALKVLEDARHEKENQWKKISQKWNFFEEAAAEYVLAREDTMSILEHVATRVEDDTRGANLAMVSAGLIAAGVIAFGLVIAEPLSGVTSLGPFLHAGLAVLSGVLVVMGALGVAVFILSFVVQWLAETRAKDNSEIDDNKATHNFQRAFDELSSAWSEMKAFGTSDVNRPSAFRVERMSQRLLGVARHAIKGPSEQEIRTLLNDIKSHKVN